MDKQSLQSCAAPGGEMMLLSGNNFHHHSKVVFLEKAQGRTWGEESKQQCVCVCVCVHRDMCVWLCS